MNTKSEGSCDAKTGVMAGEHHKKTKKQKQNNSTLTNLLKAYVLIKYVVI